MLSLLWTPVMIAILALQPTGALAHPVAGNGALGHRVVTAAVAVPDSVPGAWPAASSADGARRLRLAAIEPAPLVTDSVPAEAAKRGLPAVPLSAAMAQANAIRQAAALNYLRHAHPAAAKVLLASQQPQVRNYFCGPATVSEMLAQMKVTLAQLAAASELRTTQAGTDWSDAGGYPVPRVLNANQKLRSFVAVALPWTPTAAQIKTFEIDLVTDINHGTGVPIAGNAYEVPGGPHLVGHPPGQTIMHWFDIRGYAQSGAITEYEDSVHGATSIGWSAAVPAYSSLSSGTIVNIVGARGYVW